MPDQSERIARRAAIRVVVNRYWPIACLHHFLQLPVRAAKNVIGFKYVVSVLRMTLKNGRHDKFESSIENVDGLCKRVVELARMYGVADIATGEQSRSLLWTPPDLPIRTHFVTQFV